MKQAIAIRDETDADIGAITEVTIAAFETLAISNHTEQFVIEALRAANALTLSLVAEVDGRVVGHIAFSPVGISDGSARWYGLGPLSVLPDYQRQGIGSALILGGLSRLKRIGASGCCLVGHPEYYRRFGFRNIRGFVHPGVPEEVFLALVFDGCIPQGNVEFHEGFKADRPPRHAAAYPQPIRHMITIEPYDDSKRTAIVRLSLRAWEPVFESIANTMDPDVHREQHPDWRVTQRRAVESACADDDVHVWVASQDSRAVAFVALKLHAEDRIGEIYMIAVDPDFQHRGIATALTQHALAWLKQAGMTTAMVETGGDPGHAAARRTYESAGFRLFPVAKYFKKL